MEDLETQGAEKFCIPKMYDGIRHVLTAIASLTILTQAIDRKKVLLEAFSDLKVYKIGDNKQKNKERSKEVTLDGPEK